MRIIKEFRVVIIFFLLWGLAVSMVYKNKKDYETGYVTTGNPDNSYLDTCKIYCCGD
jgi:hypothetical protein